MAASRQGLFLEEDQMMTTTMMSSKSKVPFSQSSSSYSPSSSSSQQHKGLLPLSYLQQHRRGSLNYNQDLDDATLIRCCKGEDSHHNHHHQQQLELMIDSSPHNYNRRGDDHADDISEDHVVTTTRDSSSDALGGEGGGGPSIDIHVCGTVATAAANALAMVNIEREHMFDKVVTPSDVGKLNRLVIPKQHAEKYFPLDSSTNEKGLLLNFEDRNGKPWRFRYSYWNSSQSYVMTKGWSRFVKEKKLDAGDIVSFQRGVGDVGKDLLFIDWRRRPDAPDQMMMLPIPSSLANHNYLSFHRSNAVPAPWNPLSLQHQAAAGMPSASLSGPPRSYSHLLQSSTATNHPYNYGYGYGSSSGGPYSYNYNATHHVVNPCSGGSVIYFRSPSSAPTEAAPQQVGLVQVPIGGGAGGGVEPIMPMVFESVPVVQGKAAAKRLRLFGVNLECPISESDECDILSSMAVTIPPHSTITMAAPPPPHHHILSSSSTSAIFNPNYLQLRPYNGSASTAPFPTVHNPGSPNKGKASMSLDLDI